MIEAVANTVSVEIAVRTVQTGIVQMTAHSACFVNVGDAIVVVVTVWAAVLPVPHGIASSKVVQPIVGGCSSVDRRGVYVHRHRLYGDTGYLQADRKVHLASGMC